MERGWGAAGLAASVVAIGGFGVTAREALAHDLGVSRGNIVESPNGRFHGRFVFARGDAERGLDRDGHLAIEVRVDGEACAAGTVTRGVDGDGVSFDEDFVCEAPSRSIDVIAYFGSALSCVVTVETAERMHQELLNEEHRAMSVALARPRRESPPRGGGWMIATAIALVALIAIAIRSILKRRR